MKTTKAPNRGLYATGLLVLTALVQPVSGASKSPYSEVRLQTLAAAKVQLCKGFAESTVDYYMRLKMPKGWAKYTRANEFETRDKQALHELALQRIRAEATAHFDPASTYQVSDRAAYLSEYKRAPDGFEVTLPAGVTLHTTFFTRMDGRRELINLPELFGLEDVVDKASPGVTLGGSNLPFIALRYAWLPSDADALRTGADGQSNFFIAMDEPRARHIAQEYHNAGARRATADIYLRVDKCEQGEPGSHLLVARVVGFTLYTARLTKGFFETEETWKRGALITDWRSRSP